MVHIKRMTFQGFKSFNKKLEVEMPFGLVCIAGPNGSGKSNLFDAAAFVLGELSSKGLRTENIASLIYNGGQKGKPANRAKVEIVFDNSDKRISMDTVEVRVSREINKKGHGTYRINGQLATRTKILSLLDEVGIDARGYSIIKQGQIAQFVDMTDKERLIIISDISGISSYEEKKGKALKELDQVEKKLNDAKIILREKENRLREIEREKRQAEKYNEMVWRVKTLKASFLAKELRRVNESVEQTEATVERMAERKNDVEEDIRKINELTHRLNGELQQLDETIRKRGGEDRIKIGEETEALRGERMDVRANSLSAQREIKKIGSRKKDLERNIALNKQNISVVGRERDKLQKIIEEKEKLLEETQASGVMKSQDLLFELQLKFNSVSNDIINKRSKSAKVGRLSEYREKRAKLQKEFENNKKNINAILADLNKKISKESAISGGIHDLRETIEKMGKELSVLEVRKNAYQKSLDYSVRKILEKKEEIEGIHGTVESLCKIPEEYALSIRVALGGRRNNIVVENEDIASKCINFLKQNKIGVATFLPLNKIRGRNVQRFVKEPGLVGYALDLIKFDAKYWNVVSHILFDTLIIRDFETAKRIGFGRNPMVTLQGEFVSRSGSVTGGYRRRIRATSFAQNIEENVHKLNSNLLSLKDELGNLNSKKEVLTNDVIKLREERSAFESRQETLEREIMELNEFLKGVDEKDQLLNEIGKLEKEKLRLGEEIEKLSKVSDSKKLSEFEELREEVNNHKITLASYEAKLNNILIPEKQNLERVVKLNEEEKINFLKDIKKLTKSFDEIDKRIKKNQELYDKLDDAIKGLYAKKTRVQKKIERELKRIEEKNERLKDYDVKILAKKMRLAEQSERKRSIEERIRGYEGVEIIRIVNVEDRKAELKEVEKNIRKSGPINQKALEVYDSVKAEFDRINDKFEVLDAERADVLILIDEIEKKKTATFLKTYNAIDSNFSRVFEDLTGGKGFLDLTDTENPLEGGIDVRVRTREEKKLTHLRALSGGEKSITALAFIFAIQEYNPAPFYVLDEIDAALDKENSEKLAKLLKNYSKQAQIIIISHNDSVISVADYLYGVSMNKLGESTLIGIKLPEQ